MWLLVARLCRRLANWIDPDTIEIHLLRDAYAHRARALVVGVEHAAAAGTSGEWKRHHVMARLRKEFPERSLREAAIIIEAVLP